MKLTMAFDIGVHIGVAKFRGIIGRWRQASIPITMIHHLYRWTGIDLAQKFYLRR